MDNAATTTEELTKARDGAGMVAADLRAALAAGTAVESLVLLPLVQRANELSRDIEQLLSARASMPQVPPLQVYIENEGALFRGPARGVPLEVWVPGLQRFMPYTGTKNKPVDWGTVITEEAAAAMMATHP